ncbi:hypothetical protein RCL1_005188 [Eukaryota sp. TZLM3-RCL]
MYIGIQLGSLECCVSNYKSLLSPSGEKLPKQCVLVPSGSFSTTPSFVTIKNDGTITFGRDSKNKHLLYPNNTIFEIPRLIGRRFSDPEIQENIRVRSNGTPRWPFKVKSDGTREDKAVVCVEINGKERVFTPEEICGCLLKHLVDNAENFLGESVDELTITCPAYFQLNQRQAIIKAAEMAGFTEVNLLNEPTAAALAYKQTNTLSIGQRLLVFDFGGGTLDISIVDIHKDDITVVASGGDCYLGGADIDRILVDYCLKEFKKQHSHFTVEAVKSRKMDRFKLEVETAKLDLSIVNNAEVVVDDFYNGEDLEITLTRQELENQCSSLFQRCLYTVEEVMKRANIRANQIDAVLLVGGSSRIPKIQEIMERKFGRKVLSIVQPDHALAYGACIAHLYPIRPCIVKQIVVRSDNSTSSDIRIVQLEAELNRVRGLLDSSVATLEQLRSENRRLQAIELENQTLKTQLKQFSSLNSMSHRNPEPPSHESPRIIRGEAKSPSQFVSLVSSNSNSTLVLTQQSGYSRATNAVVASETSNINMERLKSLFNK